MKEPPDLEKWPKSLESSELLASSKPPEDELSLGPTSVGSARGTHSGSPAKKAPNPTPRCQA